MYIFATASTKKSNCFNKMLPKNFIFILAIFLHGIFFMTSFAVDNRTNIIRNKKDIFEIPGDMCWNANDSEVQCRSMGGKQRTKNKVKIPCTCKCNYNNTNNVFGWFDNQWKCGRNSDVRNLAEQECTLRYLKELTSNDDPDDPDDSDDPLVTAVPKKNLQMIGYIMTYHLSCSIENLFSYLDCKSSWKQTNGDPFSLDKDNNHPIHDLNIKPKSHIDVKNYAQHLYGHIIKLKIHCSDIQTFCVLFKVKGTGKCPVAYPGFTTPSTTTTKAATTSPPPTTTTTTTSVPTTQVATHSTGAKTLPYTTTRLIFTHSHPTKETEESTVDTRTVHPIPTNGTTKLDKQSRDASTDDNGGILSGIIAGVVGGLVGLIAILVVLAFLWFKRKRTSSKRSSTQEAENNAVYDGVILDNHSSRPPGQLPSAEDEYSYAYMNTHPIVFKDQNGIALQSRALSNGHAGNMQTASGPPPYSTSPIYNTLEDPDYAKLNTAKEAPYNVLERLPEAGWKTPSNSEGPVYNTPEDPSYAKINKTNKKQQGDGSSYNVLERGPLAKMNQQNEPLYDALEKPKSTSGLTKTSEAPIYNTLEDPNYAARTNDFGDKQSSNGVTNESPYYDVLENPNSSQESPIYSVLEGPSTTSSPVYAELENPESEENHVYGALQNYDPHIYGALNSPTSTNADFDYNDEYNSIGDVIYHNKGAVDSDVYQELNENGQSSMEEQYEPLRHSNMFIDMKELNGEGQSHA